MLVTLAIACDACDCLRLLANAQDFYNIKLTQVVSCRMEPGALDPELGDAKRNEPRKLFFVNAGQATASNQDVGKVLWGAWKKTADGVLECEPWSFEPLPIEEFECTYKDPPAAAGSKLEPEKTRKPDPNKDFEIGRVEKYSTADVLARYAGYKALSTPSTTAWSTFVLGCDIEYATGRPITATIPNEETTEENDTLYKKQASMLRRALQKIYLVYPMDVEGCFGPNGEVYPIGELRDAAKNEREPKPFVVDNEEQAAKWAPQPVQFVTLISDKREGSPANNISGYHDTTRAWPLPPGHVEQLHKILIHYGLSEDFPALANLHSKRNSAMLDLEYWRQINMSQIGDAPERPCNKTNLVSPEWLVQRSNMPFGKVWVQKCDAMHPNGHVLHGTNEPLLVPLVKWSAEDRNGTPWMNVDKLPRTTPQEERHYNELQIALHRILGKAWNKAGQPPPSKRKHDGTLALCEPGHVENAMLASLDKATAEANRLSRENKELEETLATTKAALKKSKAKMARIVLNNAGERKGIVDFVNGRDAKCIVRWPAGKCQIDFGNAIPPVVTGCESSLTIRFQSSDEVDLPPLLEYEQSEVDDSESENDI